MKTTKGELLKLSKVFEFYKGTKLGVKFSYFITKNNVKIKDEVETLRELMQPSDEYKEFDKKRAVMAEEMSDKDEKGLPVINQGNYRIVERQVDFDKAMVTLRKKHSKEIKVFESQLEEYNEILKEDIDFDGYAIKLSGLPPEIEPEIMEVFIENGLVLEEN